MLERVARTIERHRMFEPRQKIGVAVSGGADSVCLLHLLIELAPRWNLTLIVLHMDHGLRGEESRADAAFVRDLAGSLGLDAIVQEAHIEAGGNLEQAARRARLDFFRSQMASGAAGRVALGHTRSDQAETVLFRFLRGAATAGLAAIRPVTREGIVRPLIELDRAEIEAWLRERGIAWRDDSSNWSPSFARNRIRHQLLPLLAREWNPAIVETLAHTADWALAEEAWWQVEIDRLAAELLHREDIREEAAVLVRADALANLPLATARRLVRHAVAELKGDARGLDFHHVAAFLELAARHEGFGQAQAPGVSVTRSFDWLRFVKVPHSRAAGPYRLTVEVPGAVQLPAAGLISLELVENTLTSDDTVCVYNSGEVACLDWLRVSGPLELRSWLPGDHYRPVGHAGGEKLKLLFEKARIPSWERAHWPILTGAPGIVWARRFGPAAGLAADSESRTVLRIRDQEDTGLKLESGRSGLASK